MCFCFDCQNCEMWNQRRYTQYASVMLCLFFFFASGCIDVGILHDSTFPPSIKKYHKCTNCPICTIRKKKKKVLKGIVPCFNSVLFFFNGQVEDAEICNLSLLPWMLRGCRQGSTRPEQRLSSGQICTIARTSSSQPVTVNLTHQEIRSVVFL